MIISILCRFCESASSAETPVDFDIGGVCDTADLYDRGWSVVGLHKRPAHKIFIVAANWMAQSSVLQPGNDSYSWSTADE